MPNVNFGFGNNPYGAVPEALKETRLSLRDIMADYMATKVRESNLKLDLAKVNTETELVRSGAERDKIANLRELARIDIDKGQAAEAVRANQAREKLTGEGQAAEAAYRKDTLTQQGRVIPSQIAENEARTKFADTQTDVINRGLEKQPLSSWAQSEGIDPEILTAMGFSDPNASYTRNDADKLMTRFRGYIPHFGMALANERRKAIEKALPAANPKDIPMLEQQYKKAVAQGVMYGRMTQKDAAWSAKDESALISKLISDGQTAAEAAQTVQTVRAGLKEIKSAGDDLNSAPDAFEVMRKKIAVDPFFDDKTIEAATIIQTLAPETLRDAINKQHEDRMKKGDYKGAYDYLLQQAELLSSRQKSAAAPAVSDLSGDVNMLSGAPGIY